MKPKKNAFGYFVHILFLVGILYALVCGIGDLEKLVGKKRLAALCADYITKPAGKPTLVTEDDKRPAYNAAANDFKDINL